MEETFFLFFFPFSNRNVNHWCRCKSLSLLIWTADRAHHSFCLWNHEHAQFTLPSLESRHFWAWKGFSSPERKATVVHHFLHLYHHHHHCHHHASASPLSFFDHSPHLNVTGKADRAGLIIHILQMRRLKGRENEGDTHPSSSCFWATFSDPGHKECQQRARHVLEARLSILAPSSHLAFTEIPGSRCCLPPLCWPGNRGSETSDNLFQGYTVHRWQNQGLHLDIVSSSEYSTVECYLWCHRLDLTPPPISQHPAEHCVLNTHPLWQGNPSCGHELSGRVALF